MKFRKNIFVLTSLILTLMVAYFSYQIWMFVRRDVVLECLLSINRVLNDSKQSLNLKTSQNEFDVWSEIDDADALQLIKSTIKSGRAVCSKLPTIEDGKDPWGNKIHIAVKLTKKGEYQFKLWSNGADGIGGTPDDIVTISQ